MPNQNEILLINIFKKCKNHAKVTVCLLQDRIILISVMNITSIKFIQEKNHVRECFHSSGLRFTLKVELTKEQKVPEMKGETQYIYKLIFEKDDAASVELYTFQENAMKYLEILRNKICCLDYQIFYDLDKLVGKGSFASVFYLYIYIYLLIGLHS